MRVFAKRRCLTCHKWFIPKSDKNIYCERICFKKANYKKMKGEELLNAKKFPVFRCPSCDTVIELDFNPIKKSRKWLKFKCPGCNVLMISVVDFVVTEEVIS